MTSTIRTMTSTIRTMTSTIRTVVGRLSGGNGAAESDRPLAAPPVISEPAGFSPGPLWMRIVPPLAALVVMLGGIEGASYFPDESATLCAVHRSFSQLQSMLYNIDAVHGPYYMLIWVVARFGGTSELAIRMPSALAMVVAAAGVAAIGRRVVSPRAGLAAGLVFAGLPLVSFYGQDARPYAIMTAFATLASYALLRALEAGPGRRRSGWLMAYAACMAGLGLAQVLALLLITAHAVTVTLRCLSRREQGRWSLALGWLAAVVFAVASASAILVLGWKQRSTLIFMVNLPWSTSLYQLFGSNTVMLALGVTLACGIAASAITGRLRARWPGGLAALCVPWLVLPPVLLLVISISSPAFAVRFVAYGFPAIALLAGAALDALGWLAGAAGLIAIVLAGLPLQLGERAPGGHGSDIRLVDQIIAAHRRPGDAVLYGTLAAQYRQFAYPYGLASLRDITLLQTPAKPATSRARW